jgi:hypothetical protein
MNSPMFERLGRRLKVIYVGWSRMLMMPSLLSHLVTNLGESTAKNDVSMRQRFQKEA